MSLGPKQIEQIRFANEEGALSLAAGAFKSGKTYGSGVALGLHTQRDPEPRNNLVIGRRLSVMEKSVIPGLKVAASAVGADFEYKSSRGECRIGKHDYTFIAYTDKHSVGRIQGIPNVHSIVADEVTLLNDEFLNMAASRLERPDSKLWATCNPAHPLNFVKKLWLDKGRFDQYQTFFMRDNPSLDEATIQRQEAMFSGVFKMRMVDSIWAAGEGVILMTVHYADNPDPSQVVRTDFGFDYGTSSPSAITVLQTLKGGRYHIPATYKIFPPDHGSGYTDDEQLDIVMGYVDQWKPKSIVCDPAAASFKQSLNRVKGKPFYVRNGNNDRKVGARVMQNALANGRPTVAEGMTDWEEERLSWIWDPEKEDSPIDGDDHILDSGRYVIMDRVKHSINPIPLPKGF